MTSWPCTRTPPNWQPESALRNGLARVGDRRILEYAVAHGFILVSTDSDFERLLQQFRGAKVVFCVPAIIQPRSRRTCFAGMRSASLNCLLRGINWSFSTSSFRSEVYDHLRANGHLVAEMPLQPSETALTLYWKNGKVATTDGPYAETKEQLGGIQILEARDLNHPIQLISQLPGFKLAGRLTIGATTGQNNFAGSTRLASDGAMPSGADSCCPKRHLISQVE
jgi:hypothetical protein